MKIYCINTKFIKMLFMTALNVDYCGRKRGMVSNTDVKLALRAGKGFMCVMTKNTVL